MKDDLRKLEFRSKNQFLAAAGIDVERYRETEKKVDDEFSQIFSSLHKVAMETGEARVGRHEDARKFLTKTKSLMALDHELIVSHFADFIIWPACVCFPTEILEEVRDTDEAILRVPDDPSTGIAEIAMDAPQNMAQSYLSVSGGGTGTTRQVTIKTTLKFAYTPETSGTYCINPEVYMNGWWLLWTWGSCGGGPDDQGTGSLHVKLNICVEQLADERGRKTHTILEKSSVVDGSGEGAVDYASPDDGGSELRVSLTGGDQAIIFVECEISGEITNAGRAIIDMKEGRGFYFKVPTVTIGKQWCIFPPIEWPPVYEHPRFPPYPPMPWPPFPWPDPPNPVYNKK